MILDWLFNVIDPITKISNITLLSSIKPASGLDGVNVLVFSIDNEIVYFLDNSFAIEG